MDYALRERIGHPDLFTGRKEELDYFLGWISDIKKMNSQSSALLARSKMGKTALMQRLFNITYFKNDGIIPFYYEIKEHKVWVVDFCMDFFLTFIYQYIAFKSRKPEYLMTEKKFDMSRTIEIAKKEGLDYLVELIEGVNECAEHEAIGRLWETVREAPQTVAFLRNEFIVQMIDEFQFFNTYIYLDKAKTQLIDDMASPYLSTAESKIAPLLVSGSWVGWLMSILGKMTARFVFESLPNMPEDESIEMVYNYSSRLNVPVTEETAYLIAQFAEGSPFYISSVMRSRVKNKDLTTLDGLARAFEYETLADNGRIKTTWMEYIRSAFPRVNDRNAKNIVLYLCKNRDREVTRKEILDDLKLNMTDATLEQKLKALVKSDIISQGQTNFRYRGVKDNIFDKVFRGVYQDEIEQFNLSEIKKEYDLSFEQLQHKYRELLGKFNYRIGYFAEYLILDRLRVHAVEKNEFLKSITQNLPMDFNFCEYSRVWKYNSSPEYSKSFNLDIYARSLNPGDYSIIGEVKCRDIKKFSKEEAVVFERKFTELKKNENIERAIGFIFSRSGFTKEAEGYCREKGIAYSEDEMWLGEQEV